MRSRRSRKTTKYEEINETNQQIVFLFSLFICSALVANKRSICMIYKLVDRTCDEVQLRTRNKTDINMFSIIITAAEKRERVRTLCGATKTNTHAQHAALLVQYRRVSLFEHYFCQLHNGVVLCEISNLFITAMIQILEWLEVMHTVGTATDIPTHICVVYLYSHTTYFVVRSHIVIDTRRIAREREREHARGRKRKEMRHVNWLYLCM